MGKEEIFETIIRDMDGRVLGTWKVMKKDYPKVVRILNNKFGLQMIIRNKDESSDLDDNILS